MQALPTYPGSMRALLLFAGLLSVAAWAVTSLAFEAHGGSAVYGFLSLMTVVGVAWLLASWACSRLPWKPRLGLEIAVITVLLRLAALPAGLPGEHPGPSIARDLAGHEIGFDTFLLYDDDVWRYLWEGHMVASGADPYRLSPSEVLSASDDQAPWASALTERVWGDIGEEVGYPDYRSIYPPGAQAIFALAHQLRPGSVLVLKLMLIALELLGCWLVWRLIVHLDAPRWTILLYAWNPLLIKEVAASAHVDGAMVTLLVAGVLACFQGRRILAGGLTVLALLIKPSAAVLAIPALRRLGWRGSAAALVVGMIGWLPFAASLPAWLDNFKAFSTWVFNPGIWLAIESFGHALGLEGRFHADLVTTLAILALMAWQARRDDGSELALIDACLLLLSAVVLLSPAAMPWYLLWMLPFAALRKHWPLLGLTLLVFTSYLVYVDGIERAWWLWIEHGCFALALGGWLWHRRRSR